MRRLALLCAFAGLAACGGPAPQETAETPQPAAEKASVVPDERRRFPAEGRLSMEVVPDRLLDKDYLPGGNVARYEKDGKAYTLFLLMAEDPQQAAFLAVDIKDQLENPKYVPSFGGYFGMEGADPIFVFPKGRYVAGVVGLKQADADAVARDFAARIPG